MMRFGSQSAKQVTVVLGVILCLICLPWASAYPSNTSTASSTETSSITMSSTMSPPPTATTTDSQSHSETVTVSPPPTPSKTDTITVTPPPTGTKTDSRTESLTITVTPLPTRTQTFSWSRSDTVSRTESETVTPPPTRTQTFSATVSPVPTPSKVPTPTRTFSKTLTASQTETEPPTRTQTFTRTGGSLTVTMTDSHYTPSASYSPTKGTDTLTESGTVTVPLTETETVPDTLSFTRTIGTQSRTFTLSSTFTSSLSRTCCTLSETATVTVPMTPSETISSTITQSLSDTVPITPTETYSDTVTGTLSMTESASLTETYGTLTQTESLSAGTMTATLTDTMTATLEPTATHSLELTETLTQSETMTESETITVSMSPSVTHGSISESITFGSYTASMTESVSFSLALTTTPMPPTTSPVPTPSRSLPTKCPGNCMFGECAEDPRHKYWFYCKCFGDPNRGYWAGSEFDGPCDRCKTGYFGARCDRQCPGGTCATCGGHGYCDDGRTGTGKCSCWTSEELGYWSGGACTTCAPSYYALDCKSKCECVSENTKACNEGRFGDGTCECHYGYLPPLCGSCDPNKITTCVQQQRCPGPPDMPCSHNGACMEKIVSNKLVGECECNATWAGLACSIPCPMHNGQPCNGHGTCSEGRLGDGTCECSPKTFLQPDCVNCARGYYGTDCDEICPGGLATPCNNNGTCLADGSCVCNGIYGGTACEIPCPRDVNGTICGHGVCLTDATCKCFSNKTHGYWALNGHLCDICDAEHGGPGCQTACPRTPVGGVCNGASKGTCNRTSGECDCSPGACGKQCADLYDYTEKKCVSCLDPFQWGLNCKKNCTCSQEHSTCNGGKGGDGTCNCFHGWSGDNCNVPCDGGSDTPCGNHGECIQATGHCICDAGFAGQNCTIPCPGRVTVGSGVAFCNNHGECNATRTGDGTCTCSEGWAWPRTGCDTSCDCSGQGYCEYPSNMCLCYGNFDGTKCDRCKDGWAGTSCNLTCVNGTTKGYICACHPGFGGEQCNKRCPVSNGKVCNDKGTCLVATAQCMCKVNGVPSGYVGPACQCSNADCRATKNIYHRCNSTDGQCICLEGRAGEGCEGCVEGRWGADCGSKCQCNDKGWCDQNTGACTCFRDDRRGYWQGSSCDNCADGFMGANCELKSVNVAVMAPLGYKLDSLTQASVTYGYLDKKNERFYAGGQPIHCVFNTSSFLGQLLTLVDVQEDAMYNPFRQSKTAAPTNMTSNATANSTSPPQMGNVTNGTAAVGNSTISNATANTTAAPSQSTPVPSQSSPSPSAPPGNGTNSTEGEGGFVMYWDEPCTIYALEPRLWNDSNKMTYLTQPNVSCVSNVTVLTGPTNELVKEMHTEQPNFLRVGTDKQIWYSALTKKVFVTYTPGNFAICVTTSLGKTYCRVHNETRFHPPVLMPDIFSLVRVLDYSPFFDRVVIAGSDLNFPPKCLIVFSTPDASPMDPPPFDINDKFLNTSCVMIDCMYEVDGALFFGAVVAKQVPNSPIKVQTAFLGRIDLRTGNMTGVELLDGQARCNAMTFLPSMGVGLAVFLKRLVKFSLEPGTNDLHVYGMQLLGSQMTLSMHMFEEQQIVYAPLSASTGVEVQRFYLVETLSLKPILRGLVGVSDRRGGTLITVQGRGFRPGPGAKCRIGVQIVSASVVSDTQLVCLAPETISSETCLTEMLEVTMNGQVYTQNRLEVDRPNQPVLNSISPNRLRVGTATDFIIEGRGIVETEVARCRFTDTSLQQPLIVDAVYIPDPGRYKCPRVSFSKPTSAGALASIALDGQVFSTFEVSFSVVGMPAAIECSPPLVHNQTSPSVEFHPPVVVYVIDNEGNRLLEFDTAARLLTVVPARTYSFNYTLPVGIYTSKGVGKITGFSLKYPDSGFHDFQVSTNGGQWTTPLTTGISYGAMAKLRVAVQPFNPANAEFVTPGKMIPSKTEVTVVDVAGSPVLSADGALINVSQGVIVNDTLYTDYEVILGEPQQILVNSQGSATLERDLFVGAFGWDYVYFLALATDGDINVTTRIMPPRCEVSEYWVFNETECIPCPNSKAFCNGTNMLEARDGYWRVSADAYEFYKCPQTDTCLSTRGMNESGLAAADSGVLCADGYEGPLCSICIPGYGRGFRGLCEKCPGFGRNIGQVIVLFVVFYAVLTLTVILMVQNWRALETRIGQMLVVWQIGVLYMQTTSLLEFLELEWAENIKNMFSLVGTLSDFRLAAIEAANCLFNDAGMVKPDMAILYTLFVLFVPPVALGAQLILRLKPKLFMSAESLKLRETKPISGSKPKGHHYVKEHQRKTLLLVSTQVVLFFIFQSATLNTFSVFPCREVDISPTLAKEYLAVDMRVDCDSKAYVGYKIFATIAAFLYSVVIPVGSFFFIGWMKSLYDEDYYVLYSGWLIVGLKKKTFYWQGLIYVRKVVFILIIVFAEYPLDCYFFIWFMSCFAGMQLKMWPYENRRHNIIDAVSMMSIILSANIGLVYNIIYEPPDGGQPVRQGLTISLMIIQVATYLVFLSELARLWIWEPMQERQEKSRRDREHAVEEGTKQITARLAKEEKEEAARLAPKRETNTFSELMDRRRKRNERHLSYDYRETRDRREEDEEMKVVRGDKPLTMDGLLHPPELAGARGAPASARSVMANFEEVEMESSAGHHHVHVPKPSAMTEEEEEEGVGPRSTIDVEELERDIDRFMDPGDEPLFRMPKLPQYAGQEAGAQSIVASRGRPVELEAKYKHYLVSLEEERKERSRQFAEEYYNNQAQSLAADPPSATREDPSVAAEKKSDVSNNSFYDTL